MKTSMTFADIARKIYEGDFFLKKNDIIYPFLKMSFQIKVGLNVWFYSIFPTHS